MGQALAEWLVEFNAKGALTALEDFASKAREVLSEVDQQAKEVNPGEGIAQGAAAAIDPVRRLDAAVTDLGRKADTLGAGLKDSVDGIIEQLLKIPKFQEMGATRENLAKMAPDDLRRMAEQAGIGTVVPPLTAPEAKQKPLDRSAGFNQYYENDKPGPHLPVASEREVAEFFADALAYAPKPTTDADRQAAAKEEENLQARWRLDMQRRSLGEPVAGASPGLDARLRKDTLANLKGEGGQIGYEAAFHEAINDKTLSQHKDLAAQLREVDKLYAQGTLTAAQGQRAVSGLLDESNRRLGQQRQGLQAVQVLGLGLVSRASHAASELAQLGFEGTGEQAVAAHYRRQLGRQVASIAAPLMMERVGRESQLAGWLQRRSPDEAESMRSVAMFTRTALPMMMAPHLAGMVARLTGSQSLIPAALGRAMPALGIGAGLMMSTPAGRETMTEVARALEPVAQTLLEAVRELRPTIESFAHAIGALAPIIGMVASRVQPGAMIGGLTGYMLGGKAGAVGGALAGQALDTLGGQGTTGSILEKTAFTQLGASLGSALGPYGTIGGAILGGLADTANHFGLFGKGSESPNREGLMSVPQGWENIEDTWLRVNAAAAKLHLQEQMVDYLREIANNTAQQPVSTQPGMIPPPPLVI
jgi:hypothetical protein